jgi:diguanylate cyclase (GGDEF)-like protein
MEMNRKDELHNTQTVTQNRQSRFLTALIDGFNKRTSLTLKMVIITVLVGLTMWISFDVMQARILKNIFQSQLNERLKKQALNDRLSFDRYVKAHIHSVRLFITQRNFSEYIEKQNWSSEDKIEIRIYRRSPEWFPKSSVLRTFAQPRFALLLDERGKLREVYQGLHREELPLSLLQPSQELLLKSYKQNFMTNFEGKPYLVASERYLDSMGNERAILMLASPIDDVFLAATIGSSISGHIVALLTAEEKPRILVSSNLDEMSVGMPLNTLQEHYLVTGKEFFDYGASEQVIKFVSFISLDEVRGLVKSIISSERQLRIIGIPVVIGSFALLMFWVTQRIQFLTQRISDFSHRTLGVRPKDLRKGDQLFRLEERFQHLTEEVLEARDVIKRDAEERLLLEKKNIEMRQKEKQLGLLQSVTQAVGVGVIKKSSKELEAVNQQMEQFAEMCGGLFNFDIGDVEDMECNILDRNGINRVFHIRSPDIFKGEKIFLVRDITKFKEQTDALEHMAMHDALTGLPNRALLHDRLQQAIFVGQREEKSVALLMMDLDRFKEINDTLGHHIGDLVLKEVGERLLGVLRKSDTFARLGGDEFAVVLPVTDVEHAKEAADKLLMALEEPFMIEGHNLYIGASIGIVFSPDHGEDASTLLQRADVAMYVAKNARSGHSIYSPDHDQHSLQNLVIMGDLRHAIDNNELLVYYQPKISFKTDSICGIEALIRWNHPKHGFVPPEEIIPLAEYTGIIKPLTTWVLNTALRQYVNWCHMDIGMKIGISINLSTRTLLDAQFPREVAYLLRTWKITPSALELEITESAVMADPDFAMKILKKLDSIGVRLSIDDFGTGYSSLAYLKKLPVDEIKIDKSFVMNMAADENDTTIVRSTIDLAHNLGLKEFGS